MYKLKQQENKIDLLLKKSSQRETNNAKNGPMATTDHYQASNPSKQSETRSKNTNTTLLRSLAKRRKQLRSSLNSFPVSQHISDRGNGIQRAKSRWRWEKGETSWAETLRGRLIILTEEEFVCVAGHSIILTAAKIPLVILSNERALSFISRRMRYDGH